MTTDSILIERPHRRFNALTGEWVFVSPQRTMRPWQGRREPARRVERQAYDPSCYLCPGNLRANGDVNPRYESTYVFKNDFPAFLPTGDIAELDDDPLLQARTQNGTCRVVCYSPRHDLTLADMPVDQIRGVVDTWVSQDRELSASWRWVQIFENKGELMGCSNSHPHGQIWAGDFIPNEVAKELCRQREWFDRHATSLLLDYAEKEYQARERVVAVNAHWMVVVPWWAIWPFETLVLPRRLVRSLAELLTEERDALADILSHVLRAYDLLFDVSFPYSFGWHGALNGTAAHGAYDGSQLHAHFYPPLLRSATVKKFMVGYEMLAEAQRDITPEQAAERLRRVLGDSPGGI